MIPFWTYATFNASTIGALAPVFWSRSNPLELGAPNDKLWFHQATGYGYCHTLRRKHNLSQTTVYAFEMAATSYAFNIQSVLFEGDFSL